mmetsp:Transcript_43738/g.95084  ORF Transcript_43738/g.95084 Transcript_43738/m.95084 type:complete len:223 (+) Transcript_43738:157-825(+)
MFRAAAPQRLIWFTLLLFTCDCVASWVDSCNKEPTGMLRVPIALTSAFIMGLMVIGTPGIGKITRLGPMPMRAEPDALAAKPKPCFCSMLGRSKSTSALPEGLIRTLPLILKSALAATSTLPVITPFNSTSATICSMIAMQKKGPQTTLLLGTLGNRFSARKAQLPSALNNPSRDALAKPSTPTSVSPLLLTEMSKMGANCTTPSKAISKLDSQEPDGASDF